MSESEGFLAACWEGLAEELDGVEVEAAADPALFKGQNAYGVPE